MMEVKPNSRFERVTDMHISKEMLKVKDSAR